MLAIVNITIRVQDLSYTSTGSVTEVSLENCPSLQNQHAMTMGLVVIKLATIIITIL